MNQLSNNFLKDFIDKTPVLQILQSAPIESDIIRLRLRCSDGINAYDQIGLSKDLEKRILDERLYKSDKHSLIKILKYMRNGCAIVIQNYKVVAVESEVIGTPKSFYCECHGYGDNENLTGFKTILPNLQKLEDDCIPIKFITPYLVLKFTIKVKVDLVEKIREVCSKSGPSMYLSVWVKDLKGEEIVGTKIKGFGETASRFVKVFTESKAYFVELQPSCIKPRYNVKDIHLYDYEIVLNSESIVTLIN